MSQLEIRCNGCRREPDEIPEYVFCARDEDISPVEYVQREEGTYNYTNGHFLCDLCYIKAGMPTAPMGWTAP